MITGIIDDIKSCDQSVTCWKLLPGLDWAKALVMERPPAMK
jgi:hypothetical protein